MVNSTERFWSIGPELNVILYGLAEGIIDLRQTIRLSAEVAPYGQQELSLAVPLARRFPCKPAWGWALLDEGHLLGIGHLGIGRSN